MTTWFAGKVVLVTDGTSGTSCIGGTAGIGIGTGVDRPIV